MAIKLAPARPDDRYMRMYYVFEKKGDNNSDKNTWYEVCIVPADRADDSTGWIEFWAEDAKACKESLKRFAGRLYVLGERREKRKQELSDDKAAEELEEFRVLTIEALAFRTKDWNLVDSSGNAVSAPVTFENAKAVYSDEDHDLRDKAQEYLNANKNFPLRASDA